MSFQALNSAISGLRIAQLQLNNISNNISNAGTDGYTRKILPQSTQVINSTGQTIGVQPELLLRNVDLNLQRDYWTQISKTSFYDVQASYLSQVEAFHGPPDSEISIAAELSQLKDSIAALADNPIDSLLQRTVLEQAENVADTFNEFGDMMTRLRNDAQTELEVNIDRVNDLLIQIAELNGQVRGGSNIQRSTVALEDQRDLAIRELSEYMDVTYFTRGDGVVVVQSSTGVLLADEQANDIYFDPSVLGPLTTYPTSAAGVYIGGNPATNPASTDVTETELGGKIGALLDLRDETLLRYQAQIDELAHKTARRFEAQGLRMFTGPDGTVPDDTAPEISAPAASVEYVGFASSIQVNALVRNDPTLITSGTYTSDTPLLEGSSEVLTRVLEFTFGEVSYQEAAGIVDITIASSGSADLQEHLGLYSGNEIVLGPDLTQYSEIDSAGASTNDLSTLLTSDFLPNYPNNDEFRIQLYDRSDAAIATTIDIDLSTLGADPLYAIGAVDPSGTLSDGTIDNALDQMVAYINTTIITEEGALNIPTDIQARASINAFGQFVFTSRADVEFVASGFANAMTDTGFNALFGANPQLFETEDPYFEIQIGGNDPVRVSIAPGEDENDLKDKLEKLSQADAGVVGLMVDDTEFLAGFLNLRPGIDDTALGGPHFGGSMRIVSGPAQADGTGVATAGDSVVAALFGNATPVSSIEYGSETFQNLGVGSGTFVSFRSEYLGPDLDINTGVVSGSTLVDYAQKMISAQAQDLSLTENRMDDEETLQGILEQKLLNDSGVNIDEELSHLILVQTAYSAAARTVTAADELFQELLNAVR